MKRLCLTEGLPQRMVLSEKKLETRKFNGPYKNCVVTERMNGDLRVLFSAVSAKSGGSAVYIKNLSRCRTLKESPHQFIFLVPPGPANSLGDLSANIRVIATTAGLGSPWKRFLWDQLVLRRIVNEQKVDVLVSASDFGMFLPPCREILMIGNSLYFSSFYSKQILRRKSFKFRLQLFLRRCLVSLSVMSAKVVVTPSQSMMTLIKQVSASLDGKLFVNHLGVPMEHFSRHQVPNLRECKVNGGKRFRILYVSEYNDHKNLTVLLNAVLILRDQGIDDCLLVSTVDPWQFPDVEIVTRKEDHALAVHPLISPFVKFTGLVPYEDVPKLYAQSDLFVFPSLAESFGYPLVEAMASGLPVLAADIPICREICGEAAIYFNPLNAEDLAQRIITLRDNPERRKELGALGRKRAIEQFDWRDHVKRLLELIDMTAKEKKQLR